MGCVATVPVGLFAEGLRGLVRAAWRHIPLHLVLYIACCLASNIDHRLTTVIINIVTNRFHIVITSVLVHIVSNIDMNMSIVVTMTAQQAVQTTARNEPKINPK